MKVYRLNGLLSEAIAMGYPSELEISLSLGTRKDDGL